ERGRRSDGKDHRDADCLHKILLADTPDGRFLLAESGVSAAERRRRWEDLAAASRVETPADSGALIDHQRAEGRRVQKIAPDVVWRPHIARIDSPRRLAAIRAPHPPISLRALTRRI